MNKDILFLDVETYSNYFLICFIVNNRKYYYEVTPKKKLSSEEIKQISYLLKKYTSVGFNSKDYDLPLISACLVGYDNKNLKLLSDSIIHKPKGTHTWQILAKNDLKIPFWEHIDIIQILTGTASLKLYGARVHTTKLQDLPYNPDDIINNEKRKNLIEYCFNDIYITIDLYKKALPEINLRKVISDNAGVDVRSKSDAQIAEKLINKTLHIPYKQRITEPMELVYKCPEYVSFKSNILRDLKDYILSHTFKTNEKGKIQSIKKEVTIGNTTYSFGIGGLHSTESSCSFFSDSDTKIVEIDVVSFYPSLIINNNYYPREIGERFITLYKKFYNDRILAKKNNEKYKSATYKIMLNGSYGKFGSPYSSLYAPRELLNTTVTGQFSLLMLIEALEEDNIPVISANTDSVTVMLNRHKEMSFNSICSTWREKTNLDTECLIFKSLYKESVNQYVGITEEGEVKSKGVYAQDHIAKNPIANVCRQSIINYILNKTPIVETINSFKDDIRNFLYIRKVEGGAKWKDSYLGKVVRWYYGLNGEPIYYVSNNNKVATTDGAIPLMNITSLIKDDINKDNYVSLINTYFKRLNIC